jgi:transcriptional regulator with XRE-family HTH domain
MPRRVGFQKRGRRQIFVKQWREFRGLSQEQLASRIDDMSAAQLSRIENAKQPYTQDFLEAAAEALQTDVASLLMRDPSKEDPNDPNSIWSLWDRAKPGERRQIIGLTKAIMDKTGT